MNIKRMLKLSPHGIAAGVDISEESVKKSMAEEFEIVPDSANSDTGI